MVAFLRRLFIKNDTVNVVINGQTYCIISSWSPKLRGLYKTTGQNTVSLLLESNTFRDDLEILSDIPRDLIDAATDESLFPLYTLCSFLNATEFYSLPAVQVSAMRYEDFEIAKKELNKYNKPWKQCYSVAKVYYKDETEPEKLIALGADIINQINTFLESFKEMITSQPTGEEESAGISELSKFETFGTVYSMAGEDITKMKAIFDMPAQDVYIALYYSWTKNRYIKNLQEAKLKKS